MAEKKEHKDDPLRDVEDSVNDKGLQDKAEKLLEGFRDKLDESEPADQSNESDDSTSDNQDQDKDQDDQTDDSESKDDTNSDDDKDEDASEDKKDGSKDKEDPPEAYDIPDGHIRAMKGQGWEDEDIAKQYEADPDLTRRLAQNAYETSNKITRQFSAIGREKAEATRKAAEQAAPEIKDFITADEIAKVADGDEATAVVLKAMNQRIKDDAAEAAKRRVPGDVQFAKSDQEAATARANATADANALQAVNNFFSADDMKPYTDFYGVVKSGQDWDDITPNQKAHRIAVLQEADCYKVGSASQGIEVSTAIAMEKAHLLVTDSMRESITVNKIKKALKKRTKTLRPSDSKRSAKSTEIKKATNRDEAVKNAGERLAALKQKGW